MYLSDEAEGSEDLSDVQGEGGRFVIAARAIGRGFVASCTEQSRWANQKRKGRFLEELQNMQNIHLQEMF